MPTLAKPYFDVPFETYFYDAQFLKYLIQFMAIFEGMEIRIGKNSFDSASDKIYVPIRRGNADRVVNNIIAKGTANTPLRLPIFSAEIVRIEKNESRIAGRFATNRSVHLPVGGSFPDDMVVTSKKTPTPYTVYFELSLMTSNDSQKFQIVEQILTLFDPELQIQISDNIDDWNKIGSLMLENINLEDTQYPYGIDQKIIVTTFQFSTVAYLQTPIEYKTNFIKSIYLKLDKLNSASDIYEQFVYDSNNGFDDVEIANINEVADIDNMKQ